MIPIEEALEICLSRLEQGDTMAQCLAMFPEHAAELAPLLELSAQLQAMALAPIVASPAQVEAMQARLLERAPLPQPRPLRAAQHSSMAGRWLALIAAAAAVIVLLMGGLYLRQRENEAAPLPTLHVALQESPSPATDVALLPSPSPSPSPSPEASPTSHPPSTATSAVTSAATSAAIVSSTAAASLPTPQQTASPEEAPADSASAPSIQISLRGELDAVDAAAGTLLLDGVSVQVDAALLPANLTTDTVLQVQGFLQDDGTLIAELVERSDAAPVLEELPCPVADCHPVLLILANAYGQPYPMLAASFEAGLGIGEIARLLAIAEAASIDYAIVEAQRLIGQSWGQLMRQYPAAALVPGVIIRQGQGAPGNAPALPPGQDPNRPNPGNTNGNASGNANGNANGNSNGNSPPAPPGATTGNSNGNGENSGGGNSGANPGGGASSGGNPGGGGGRNR